MEGSTKGQDPHGSTTTTHIVGAVIQRSQASTAALSREPWINPKTVARWRKRETVQGRKTGPKEPRPTVLNEEEEAVACARFIGTGPLSPRRGAPYTYVTTEQFLLAFDLESLQDLLDRE